MFAGVLGGFAVADEKRDAPRPFDVTTVEYLLRLMSEHDLAEIDLKEGDQRIRLRKGAAMPPVCYSAPPAVAPNPGVYTPGSPASPTSPNSPPAASGPPLAKPAPASPPPASTKKLIDIKSPMVGTFYTRPDPKKPEFVTAGSKVTPKTVVCTIEAMKLYNEVLADCSGTIVEICKKPGDFVEFGTVLFRVDPS